MFWSSKALVKLANIAWQTPLSVSESLAVNKMVTPDLRQKEVFGKQNMKGEIYALSPA